MNGMRLFTGCLDGTPGLMPVNRKEMEPYFEDHIQDLAERYKGKVQRWMW